MYAKTGLVLIAAVATAGALAGCGGSSRASATTSDPTTAAPTTQATVTDTVVPPASSVTSSAPATVSGPHACATVDLAVTLGTSEGAAGSIDIPLHFTNTGATACTITAYPGVSLVAPGTGKQVGAAAVRTTGAPTPTITLSHGAVATAMVAFTDYQNFPASACAATPVSGFRVYPPNNTAAAYVPLTATAMACTKADELTVQPVTAGAGS